MALFIWICHVITLLHILNQPINIATPAVGTGIMSICMKKKRSRRSQPPLETKDFPTCIKIANKQDPLKFSKAWIGTWIEIESDAPDDFLSKSGASLELADDTQKFCRVAFKHKDFKGGRLYLKSGLIGDPNVGTVFPFLREDTNKLK
jgi:hypothetical protein